MNSLFKIKEKKQMVFIVPPSVSPFIDMFLYAKLGITEGNTSFWKRVLINNYQVKIDKYCIYCENEATFTNYSPI